MALDDLNGACGVCHRVLDWETDLDGSNGHWVHTWQDRAREDHKPEWVPESIDTEYRCDFCNLNDPTFVLPCSDFHVPNSRNQNSVGEWLACGTCAPMISNDMWADLVERVVTTSPSLTLAIALGEATRSNAREQITMMYRELRKNIQGPLQPWAPDRG